MVKPNKVVAKALKTYDKNLSLQWNNERKWWEVWRSCKDGDHMITPVVEVCYNVRGDVLKAEPLDMRLLRYLYNSDGNRKGFNRRWKWNSRKLFDERKANEKKQRFNHLKNAAKDYYNMVCDGGFIVNGEDSTYMAPDVQGAAGRVKLRSGDNVREYRDELASNN